MSNVKIITTIAEGVEYIQNTATVAVVVEYIKNTATVAVPYIPIFSSSASPNQKMAI